MPGKPEQMREPRIVRIGLIQNTIVKPTTAPLKEQYKAICDKVEAMIDAAAGWFFFFFCFYFHFGFVSLWDFVCCCFWQS